VGLEELPSNPIDKVKAWKPPNVREVVDRRVVVDPVQARELLTAVTYCEMWKAARAFALTPEQQISPLAARPYDLRHAAVSLWLNAGVAAPDVAERAGHGVDVLLRVYAKCIDGGAEIANQRIDDALAA
jgi:hypothetical protein